MFKIFVKVLILSYLFYGCSKEVEYNKKASYWYESILKSIDKADLERADDYYASLQSEHKNSLFLPEVTLILAYAHMASEEYLLANFYLDEYEKRFIKDGQREYILFLKIKANFLGFKDANRDQELNIKLLDEIAGFKKSFPNSAYIPLIDVMSSRIYVYRDKMNKEIAGLYKRVGKPKASEFYKSKDSVDWIDYDKVEDIDTFWIKSIFE